MKKTPHFRKKLALAFFLTSICTLLGYQIYQYNKYDGNFLFHMEYTGSLNDNCIDVSLSVNGKELYRVDSIGPCTNRYGVDTVLCLPIGINSIEVSSKKLNLMFQDTKLNLLYMFAHVDIIEHQKVPESDTIREISVYYGYGTLMIM